MKRRIGDNKTSAIDDSATSSTRLLNPYHSYEVLGPLSIVTLRSSTILQMVLNSRRVSRSDTNATLAPANCAQSEAAAICPGFNSLVTTTRVVHARAARSSRVSGAAIIGIECRLRYPS